MLLLVAIFLKKKSKNVAGLPSKRFWKLLSDVLRDLVPFVQFKKHEKHPWRSVTYSQSATLLNKTLLYGCFLRFLNCTNGTKLRNASQIF